MHWLGTFRRRRRSTRAAGRLVGSAALPVVSLLEVDCFGFIPTAQPVAMSLRSGLVRTGRASNAHAIGVNALSIAVSSRHVKTHWNIAALGPSPRNRAAGFSLEAVRARWLVSERSLCDCYHDHPLERGSAGRLQNQRALNHRRAHLGQRWPRVAPARHRP